jgi:5-methylcytosine-specific restriction endonuclease McrA
MPGIPSPIQQVRQVRHAVVPITALKPHPDNYNIHPEKQLKELKQSHHVLGQFQSCVLWEQPGGQEYLIVSGHGFIEGARRDGAYNKDKHNKDGYAFRCKVCRATYVRTYQPSKDIKDRRLAYMRQYRADHREELNAQNRTYCQEHRSDIQAQQKIYRQKHSSCHRARSMAWRRAHPHYTHTYNKAYWQRNQHKLKTANRLYYRGNRERVIATNATYAKFNADSVRMRKRAYRMRNIEHHRARDIAYYQANKQRVMLLAPIRKARRRTRITQAGGSFTLRQWQELKAFYDHTCLCCGRKEPEIKLTADHVIPVFLHGTSNIENIQPLCGSCNSSKHTQIIDYRESWRRNG